MLTGGRVTAPARAASHCRAVYKASWRQAPVAVKYIVCRTDDHDSLGRAIREVVLSKKMSHPNVVRWAGGGGAWLWSRDLGLCS